MVQVFSRQAIGKLFLSVVCVVPAAHANLLTNGSFELGAFVNQGNETMVLNVGSTTITGWAVVTDQLAWIDTGNPWGLSAQDGNRFEAPAKPSRSRRPAPPPPGHHSPCSLRRLRRTPQSPL